VPTSTDDPGSATHPAQGSRGVQPQFPSVGDEQVGDLMFLEVGPQIFDRVEFRGVSGKLFQPEPSTTFPQHRLDRLAPVDGGTVPDDEQFARHVAEERLEEFGGPLPVDTPFVKSEVKVPEGETRDEREFVPIEGLAEHRGLAAWRPRAHPVRPGAQSAFVDEDDGAAFAPGFFLRPGQVTRFHCAIAISSRSMARRVGC
jgi:hypothetical protein